MSQQDQGALILWIGISMVGFHFFGWLGAGIVLAIMGTGMVAMAEGWI